MGGGRKPVWFKFVKKLNNNLWNIESGEIVDIKDVPKEYKS